MFFSELYVLMPELVVLFSVFFTTLFGAYAGNSYNKARLVAIFMSFAFLIAAFVVYKNLGSSIHIVYKSMVVNDPLLSTVKLMLFITSAYALVTTLVSSKSEEKNLFFEFPVLVGLSTLGAVIFATSLNYLVMYLGLELMSLPLYVMAALNRDSAKSSEAGMKYFILGALASGLLLFGISLHYGSTGTINFIYESGIGELSVLNTFAKVLIIVAIFFKISAAPFHMWAPDVYEGASTQSVCFFATVPKIAALVVLIRLLDYWSFGTDATIGWSKIIVFVSALSILVGSFGALMQSNLKRLLAYSAIGHVGFMMLTMIDPQSIKYVPLLRYLTIYLTMTLGAFMVLQNLCSAKGYNEQISSIAGLSKHKPFLALALSVFMFSMAGVPPLAGFFAKIYVILPLIEMEIYWLAFLAVLASVVSAYYYLKVVKVMYFDKPSEESEKSMSFRTSAFYSFLILILVLLNILFFIFPDQLLSFANYALESKFSAPR